MVQLASVLEVIADNKLVLGDRLVEIGLGAPDIESATSAIAMAQGELGHARILYNWVFELLGEPKREVKGQTGKAFESVEQVHNWLSLIAALYVIDVSQDLVLRSMLEQKRPETAAKLHKLIKEQKEHIMYSRGWALNLLNDKGSIPLKFTQELNKLIPDAEKWLMEIENSSALINAGYISKDANLTGRFKVQISGLFAEKEVSYAN